VTIDLDSTSRSVEGPAQPARLGVCVERGGATPARLRLARTGFATVAAVLVVWAFAPFILTALDAARHHRIFTGVAGYFPWDGLQYLAFVRDGHDGLIRNLFGLSGGAVFVHPIWSVTGVVQGVTGVGSVPIMAFWKVVSVAVLLAGAARLVTRQIPASRPGRRTTALGLCLFGGFTPLVLLMWSGNITDVRGVAIDLIPAAALWDYAPIAVAIGLMPFAIEGMERILAGTGGRRTALLTAACCLIIGWLHPWQAATLMLVWLGLLLWRAHDRRGAGSGSASKPALPWRRIAVVLVATAAAPAYYASLSHIDYSWSQFAAKDGYYLQITWPVLEYCVAPLVVVALLSARAARRDRGARSLVVWLFATLVVVALSPPEQYHALDGLMLPLGVLAVRAWPAGHGFSPRRLVAIAGLAALAVTFAIYADNSLHAVLSRGVTTYSELARSDVRAVTVAARADGDRPILSMPALGSAIPMLADAPTWVGNLFWTPGYGSRAQASSALFTGSMTASAARSFVRSVGTRALVEPCGWAAPLEPALAPLGFHEQAVGCARVYTRADSRSRAGHRPTA
jgi:hypothetical protein